MFKKLYFMLPDTAHCKTLVEELEQMNIPDHHIHAMAKESISLEGLPQATALQKTELAHGLSMGMIVGGTAGLLGGVLAVLFPPGNLIMGNSTLIVLATTVIGGVFGSLVSALVARDIPNHELEPFQKKLGTGQILLIIDTPLHQLEDVMQLIKTTHPEVEIAVVESEKSSPT